MPCPSMTCPWHRLAAGKSAGEQYRRLLLWRCTHRPHCLTEVGRFSISAQTHPLCLWGCRRRGAATHSEESNPMELGLRGKVAIVTGASKGIGKAIAEALAAEGVHLALCARGQPLLEEVAAALQQRTDVQVLPVAADLSTLTGVQTLVRTTLRHFSSLDILVNNAGAIRPGSLLAKPDEDWQTDWAL